MNAQLRKHFQELGRKGGAARAQKLTAAKRHQIALKAGKANKARLAKISSSQGEKHNQKEKTQ